MGFPWIWQMFMMRAVVFFSFGVYVCVWINAIEVNCSYQSMLDVHDIYMTLLGDINLHQVVKEPCFPQAKWSHISSLLWSVEIPGNAWSPPCVKLLPFTKQIKHWGWTLSLEICPGKEERQRMKHVLLLLTGPAWGPQCTVVHRPHGPAQPGMPAPDLQEAETCGKV